MTHKLAENNVEIYFCVIFYIRNLAKNGKIRYNRYSQKKRRIGMPKFFVEENQIQHNTITITGTDVNHIHHVLRLQKEDTIQITSKQTHITYHCVIQDITSEMVICSKIAEQQANHELPFSITIYQGLPKAEKMEWVIQKCTELGVDAFVPTILHHCVVKLDTQNAQKKTQRWQKIAEVAAKQSGRDSIPQVQMPQTLEQLGERLADYDACIVAYEKEEQVTLKQALQQIGEYTKIAIVIGPEGGLEEKEVQYLRDKGAKVITLGNRILRTETVALVITSNIIYDREG